MGNQQTSQDIPKIQKLNNFDTQIQTQFETQENNDIKILSQTETKTKQQNQEQIKSVSPHKKNHITHQRLQQTYEVNNNHTIHQKTKVLNNEKQSSEEFISNHELYNQNNPLIYLSPIDKVQSLSPSEQILQFDECSNNEKKNFNQDYLLGLYVGHCQLGIVHLVENKFTGEKFFMKITNKKFILSQESEKIFFNQIKIQQALKNPKIIEIYDIDNYFYIIQDQIPKDLVISQIFNQKDVNEQQIKRIAKDIVQQIQILHNNNLFNFNINVNSFKFGDNGSVLLSDLYQLHTTLNFEENEKLTEILINNFNFVTPELLESQAYDKSSDVWRLGIYLYILISGKYPFEGQGKKLLYENILKYDIQFSDFVWNYVSLEFKDLIKQMLCKNSKKRIKIDQINSHPWFKNQQEECHNFQYQKFYFLNLKELKSEDIELDQKIIAYLQSKYLSKNFEQLIKQQMQLTPRIKTSFQQQELLQGYFMQDVIEQIYIQTPDELDEEQDVNQFINKFFQVINKLTLESFEVSFNQLQKNSDFNKEIAISTQTIIQKLSNNNQLKNLLVQQLKYDKKITFRQFCTYLNIIAQKIGINDGQQIIEKQKNRQIKSRSLSQRNQFLRDEKYKPASYESLNLKKVKNKKSEKEIKIKNEKIQQIQFQQQDENTNTQLHQRQKSSSNNELTPRQKTKPQNEAKAQIFFNEDPIDLLNQLEKQIYEYLDDDIQQMIKIIQLKQQIVNGKLQAKQIVNIQIPQIYEEMEEQECFNRLEQEPENYFLYYRLSMIAIEKKQDIQNIKQYLLKIIEINPQFQPHKVRYALASIYEEEQKYKKAIEEYKIYYDYISDDEEKIECLYQIKRCYKRLNDFKRAIKTLEIAIQVDNKNPITYKKLGWIQIKHNIFKPGVDNLQKAYTLAPKNIEIMQKLAEGLLLLDGNKESLEAFDYFKRVLEYDPQNFDAAIGMAKAEEKLGFIQAAIKIIDEALLFTKTEIDQQKINNILFYQALLYKKINQKQNYQKIIQKILINDKNHISSLIEYATFLSALGKIEKAVKYFSHAIKLESTNIIANLRLGQLYQYKLKEIEKAINCYLRIIDQYPDYLQAHYFIAQCYQDQQNVNLSMKHLKKIILINPGFIEGWKQLAYILMLQNLYSRALKIWQKAKEVLAQSQFSDKIDTSILLGIADCFYYNGDYDDSIKTYLQILSDSTDCKEDELKYYIANCYLQKKDYQNAINYYVASIQFNTNFSEAYYNLGMTYIFITNFDLAFASFKQSYEKNPSNAAALYNMANCQWIFSNYNEAFEMFEQALNIDSQNLEWRNYLSNLYIEKKNYSLAKKHIFICQSIDSNYISNYVTLAKLLLSQGNNEEALKQLNIAFKLDSSNEELREILAKVIQIKKEKE